MDNDWKCKISDNSKIVPYYDIDTGKLIYCKHKETNECYFPMKTETYYCPEGYQFLDENGNVINAEKIVLTKKKKNIHFYKEDISFYDLADDTIVFSTHMATNVAIQSGVEEIHTYAISTLDFAYLLDNGYDIHLHENGKSMLVKEGTIYGDNSSCIKRGNNVMKMWIAGAFNDIFYKK